MSNGRATGVAGEGAAQAAGGRDRPIARASVSSPPEGSTREWASPGRDRALVVAPGKR